jgi:hypothetical protein
MRKLATNIMSIDPQNVSVLVLIVVAAVWLIVWSVLLTDIVKQPRSALWKGFWVVLSCVPVAGGVLYSIYELISSDWGAAFHWRKHETKTKKKK